MKGLSVAGFLFGMVIWADVLLGVMVVVGCFIFFPAWLFGGYDGCERGDGTCGWCSDLGWCDGVGVVEVFYSVAMGAGVGGVGNRGRSV